MSETPNLADCSFTKFADAFLELHRRGQAPSLEEAILEFPHLEAQIRSRLPALLAFESTLGRQYSDPITDQPLEGHRFVAELGRGSCGVVYRAKQDKLNREVAVKVIRIPAERGSVLSRFAVECEAMAKLEHPNIVPVYGYAQVESDAYLTMKLIEGFSFDRLLRGDGGYRGTMLLHTIQNDAFEFATIARDVASALAHAHANGLVHRDIKPSNLMLDSNGRVFITDFGLAKIQNHSESISQTGDVIGTPRYMAPEQLRGTADARSDIYSLGLTLYEIATGSSVRNSPEELDASRISADLREQTSQLPAELIQIIEKAAAFSPEERFQSAEEMAIVLQRFLRGVKPDRRKRKRQPDHLFRRNSRLRMLAYVCASAAAVVFLYRNPISLSSANASKTLAPEDLTLIEHLAENPTADVREYIGQVAIKSVADASSELGLSEEEQREVTAGVEDYVVQLRSGEISVDSLDDIAKSFKDSPLSDASRVMACNHLVLRSGLSKAEQASALETVRKLAYAVASGSVSRSDSRELTLALTGRTSELRKLKQVRVDDDQLRRWVSKVESTVKDFDTTGVNLRDELREMLFKADKSPRSISPRVPNGQTIEYQINQLPPELREMARQHFRAGQEP